MAKSFSGPIRASYLKRSNSEGRLPNSLLLRTNLSNLVNHMHRCCLERGNDLVSRGYFEFKK